MGSGFYLHSSLGYIDVDVKDPVAIAHLTPEFTAAVGPEYIRSVSLGLYGRNVTDERYDNARLNTGDYVLVMLSNDASEFGVRFTTRF